jgi:hypothetical protein
MRRSQRLDGFELLRLVGAPVPDWQIATSVDQVAKLHLDGAKYGWTIRTCRRDGVREMNLFYLNYTEPLKTRQVLKDRLSKYGMSEFYIVYPSWRFIFSCNVVLLDEDYYIEGKYGSQKDLALGKKGPDFLLRIPFGMRSRAEHLAGNARAEVIRSLGPILHASAKTMLPHLYAEVAMMGNRALVFYELFDLAVPIAPVLRVHS